MSNINLDGGEISVIKALGTGGGDTSGKVLLERVSDLEVAELIDTLRGLVSQGFVTTDKDSFHSKEELEKANFHVNSGYARELRDAIDPRPEKIKSKRVRRE